MTSPTADFVMGASHVFRTYLEAPRGRIRTNPGNTQTPTWVLLSSLAESMTCALVWRARFMIRTRNLCGDSPSRTLQGLITQAQYIYHIHALQQNICLKAPKSLFRPGPSIFDMYYIRCNYFSQIVFAALPSNTAKADDRSDGVTAQQIYFRILQHTPARTNGREKVPRGHSFRCV